MAANAKATIRSHKETIEESAIMHHLLFLTLPSYSINSHKEQ